MSAGEREPPPQTERERDAADAVYYSAPEGGLELEQLVLSDAAGHKPHEGHELERLELHTGGYLDFVERWRPEVEAGRVRLLLAADHSHVLAVPGVACSPDRPECVALGCVLERAKE